MELSARKLTHTNATLSIKVLWLLLALSLCSLFVTVYQQVTQAAEFNQQVKALVKSQTLTAAREIDASLNQLMTSLNAFANDITTLPTKTTATELLEQTFLKSDLNSLGVTFAPYKYLADNQYVSLHYSRFHGDVKQHKLAGYDNQSAQFNWYHNAITGNALWSEPYYEPANKALMVTYSVPFYASKSAQQRGEAALGVVSSSVELDLLTLSLKQLDLGLGGYGVLFSAQQSLISHPVFSHVLEMDTLQVLASEPEFAYLNKLTSCFENSLDYRFFNGETLSNDEHYAACTKVPHTNWTLITRMSADMFEMDKDKRRQNNIHIVAWSAAVVIFIILLLTQLGKLSWAQNNVILSSTLIVCTILVLDYARSFKSIEKADNLVITAQAQRDAFTASYQNKLAKIHSTAPEYVKTGLYVESLEFVNAKNVHLTGHAWQKLTPEQQTKITPHLSFNHTVNSTITEAYRRTLDDGSLLVGWHFAIETRQQLDYSKYPFDHKSIEVSFNQAELGGNVILIPDLDAYEKLSKIDNPAVTHNIVLDEWQLKTGYFKYRFERYNTNFGLDTFYNQSNSPELTYTINLEREFVGPFVTTLLPVMVMVCLLYACVVSMKYTPYGDLRNNITAVVFTILLAHYSIREHLQIDEVVYFEVFYFLLYLVSSVFMLIAHQYYKAQEKRGDGLVYKQLANVWFWPVITISIFVITILTYY